MRFNPEEIRRLTSEEDLQQGRDLDEGGWVRMTERNRDAVKYSVAGTPPHLVVIASDMTVRCDCDTFEKQGCCRHIVAAWQAAEREKIPESMLRVGAGARGEELSALAFAAMPEEPALRMEMTVAMPQKSGQAVRLGLRVGQSKLYVVPNIPEFLECRSRGESQTFGRGFVYEAEWMRFPEEDEAFLDWLDKLLRLQYGDEHGEIAGGGRMIRIPEIVLPELMTRLQDRRFRLMNPSGEISTCKGIPECSLPLRFDMTLGPRGIGIAGRIPTDYQPLTRDGAWGWYAGQCVRVAPVQRPVAQMLWEKQYDGKCLFEYPLAETERVIGEVLPFLKLRSTVEVSAELRRRLVQRPLETAVYLDRDGMSVRATLTFSYGEVKLNPFAPVAEKITLGKGEKLLLRDAEAEHQVLDILARAGFRVRKDHIRLSGNEAVFDFISEGVKQLQEISEVFLSREFKRLVPRRVTLSGSMRLRGDQMELLLEADGEPVEEVLALIEALSRRQRYFRLKTGEFLDLHDLAEWQEMATPLYEAAVRDGNDMNRPFLELRAFRAAYLSSMLENSHIPVTQDGAIRELTDALSGKLPEAPRPALAPGVELREYQLRGYEWMYSLDRMHMGGILADDMGLGKTAQVIALLHTVRGGGRCSLVVAPTSLTYNWLSEIHRFAPDMSAAVLSGTSQQRAGLIQHILTHGDVDVMITSYPLIRRDIDQMKDYLFRVVILDEAQNIKNAGSVAANAVKQLRADTRFALTGTPMENGVGELWSLFDFALPGYLPGYNAFVRRYQDGENAEDLLRRIRPFLTRRLKSEVLSELPDKMESVLTAIMTPEQEKLYQAALARLRPRIWQLMEERGAAHGRMEVLSALTELREICCHPALVMEDYRGESGKEELLLEILPELIGTGRRILLFSQFTRMLRLLQARLEDSGYATLYLDGDTPADERLALTERFNQGEGEIFLISLRAGGSGLNLTGADLVIHYDPWWNPATEDQATDRAHRIGQTHKVEVIRLVTAQSIEEQVVELGRRKKALFDRLITPGESVLSALSEQDIRSLFS